MLPSQLTSFRWVGAGRSCCFEGRHRGLRMTENHGYGDQRRDEPRERLLRAQWNYAGSSCAGAVRGRRADRELGAWCRAIQLGTLNWTNRVGGLKASQFETVRQGWLHSLEPGWRAALWATRTNMRLPVPISMRSPVRGLC